MTEEELNEVLEYWQGEYKKNEYWFGGFHKSIRQTDFFGGSYFKRVNKLTPEESVRRYEILDIRSKYRRECGKIELTFDEIPHADELRKLNTKMRQEEEVPVGAIGDVFLYDLIHLDKNNDLMKCMEIAFKICS